MPPGYYYATGAVLNGNVQPGSTTVGTEASLTTIYVAADTQTVNVTFVNSDGRPLQNQVGTVAINGTTGQELSYSDLIADYLTQAGYYADQTGTFVLIVLVIMAVQQTVINNLLRSLFIHPIKKSVSLVIINLNQILLQGKHLSKSQELSLLENMVLRCFK